MQSSRVSLNALMLTLAASLVACSTKKSEPSGSGSGSNGCSASNAATGVQNLSISVGGLTRTYVLSVPTNYSASAPAILVFAWHGLGGNGAQARQYFNLEVSDGRGGITNDRAIFVYPDALAADGGQAGWDLGSSGVDVALFDALLAQISASYCVDMQRIFSTGHSFGAMMTNALGCYRGDVLRAIAPVAGMPPNAYGRGTVSCNGSVGAWIAHGENDTTVDYTTGGIASRDFWLAQNGCTTTTVQDPTTPACVDYQGCRAGLPVIWCVHDQGHNWPNTRYGCDGGVCFDAGPAIWSFFASLGPEG